MRITGGRFSFFFKFLMLYRFLKVKVGETYDIRWINLMTTIQRTPLTILSWGSLRAQVSRSPSRRKASTSHYYVATQASTLKRQLDIFWQLLG